MKVLRCLTLNLWSAEAPLPARMALIEQGIRELAPDLVALQEVGEWPGLPNQAASLAERTGLQHVFAPTIAFRGGCEGLAFLSRVPIAASSPWSCRTPRPRSGASCCRCGCRWAPASCGLTTPTSTTVSPTAAS